MYVLQSERRARSPHSSFGECVLRRKPTFLNRRLACAYAFVLADDRSAERVKHACERRRSRIVGYATAGYGMLTILFHLQTTDRKSLMPLQIFTRKFIYVT